MGRPQPKTLTESHRDVVAIAQEAQVGSVTVAAYLLGRGTPRRSTVRLCTEAAIKLGLTHLLPPAKTP